MRHVAAALLVLSLVASGAAAQQNAPSGGGKPTPLRPLSSGGGASIEAPVGHRQPTLNDLPPSVRKEEQGPLRERRGSDWNSTGVPQICKDC